MSTDSLPSKKAPGKLSSTFKNVTEASNRISPMKRGIAISVVVSKLRQNSIMNS